MSNSLVQETYNSEDDDGDEIFADYDYDQHSVPTQPIQRPPKAGHYVTQPTQPLETPLHRRPKSPSPSSSNVQVSASSPYRPSPGPKVETMQRGALNRGFPNGGLLAQTLAPPGTQFRSPYQQQQQLQQSQKLQDRDSRSQTVELLFSDDEDRVVDSSEEEDQAPSIKQSIFTRDGKPVDPHKIEESPRSDFSVSRFAYNGPEKRSADVMANAYSTYRKPKVPRQTEPARALPVALPDISYDDIEDFDVRNKARLMKEALGPAVSIRRCRDALVKKRFNHSDALEYLTDEMEREEARAQKSRPPIDLTHLSDGEDELNCNTLKNTPKLGMKPAVKRDVKNAKTIAEKWSSTQHNRNPTTTNKQDRPITPPPKKPKRRLVRPQQPESSPLQPSSPPVVIAKPAKAQAPPKPQSRASRKKTPQPESDVDEGLTLLSNDEDDSNSEVEEKDYSASESKLLAFLNECTIEALVEISNQPVENLNKILEQRPFESLDAVRDVYVESSTTTRTGKKRSSKKQIGERLVDVCLEVWDGYEAVDDLVAECEELGKPVRREMERFGFLKGRNQGELQVLDLEGDRDSGIGTPVPSSSAASVDEDYDAADRLSKDKSQMKKDSMLIPQPGLMAGCTLKDYQLVGLNWLALLYSNKMSGILADDMGLGKTIQVISLLAYLSESGISKGPHLVIVPGSTLENWLREFRNFCPALRVEPYYGSQAERSEDRHRLLDELREINVIVTTYDMAVSNNDDSKFLRRTEPIVCVYDEGHTLKNSQTKRYKHLMRIPARCRLLLTGTPLQNNLQELMALLGFIMPEVFSRHQEQLEIIFKHKAKASGDSGALLSAQRISRARAMITPFILRRKKEQVLKHLPLKSCRVEYCDLTDTQKAIYDGEADKVKQALKPDGPMGKAKANILMELRKAAIHPLLFRHHYDDGTLSKMSQACLKEPTLAECDPNIVWEDLSVMTDFELNRFCNQYRTMSKFALPGSPCVDSGKVSKLVDILREFGKDKGRNNRTLVFSQFTMVMDILEQVFEKEQISFSRLDGSTKMQERQDLIDQFTQDTSISVFLLSTKAGGAGINLACANKVVIFDSSFNPQEDIQAENRAHRVGQMREVEVVRLVTKNTIEEQIYALGQTKLALDERVAGAQDQKEAEAVEKEGIDLVARMMKDGLENVVKKEDTDAAKVELPDRSDLKESYMKELQEAGLQLA